MKPLCVQDDDSDKFAPAIHKETDKSKFLGYFRVST